MQNLLRRNLTLIVVAAAGLGAAIGCEGTPSGSNGGSATGPVGSVALIVNGVPPLAFNSFAYSLDRPDHPLGSDRRLGLVDGHRCDRRRRSPATAIR